ncbi:MAG: hypothetical protein ABSA14_06050 [Acidimicrobiales bacterium]
MRTVRARRRAEAGDAIGGDRGRPPPPRRLGALPGGVRFDRAFSLQLGTDGRRDRSEHHRREHRDGD